MRYIKTLNEYIKNPKAAIYLYDRLKAEVLNYKNVNDIDFNDYTIDFGRYRMNNHVFNFTIKYVDETNVKFVDKTLKKYAAIFNRDYLILSYKKNTNVGKTTNYSYICAIKSDKLVRVNPPRYVYHVSSKKFRNSILEHGLLPMASDKWSVELRYNPAIFASTDEHNLFFPLTQYSDLWQIDTLNIPNLWYSDININKLSGVVNHNNFIMTDDPIPVKNLKLISENDTEI